MRLFLVVILLTAILPLTTEAQYVISGTVYDETETTVPGAHVFLNGTTYGTLTDKDGSFKLEDVPDGVYQLVVKFLGYKDFFLQINIVSDPAPLKISLEEDVYDLEEITVVSDRKEWERQFEIFQEHFLGTSRNAKNSEILNPEVLSFDEAPDSGILTAEAEESLRIRNDALGYRIEFYLKHFSFDPRNDVSSYYGYPIFTEMSSNRRRKNRRWNRNREETYKGSFEHFVSTLIAGTYDENGYEIRAEMRKTQEELDQGDVQPSEIGASYDQQKLIGGGARYLSRNTIRVADIFSRVDDQTYELRFVNFLNVTYTKEKESYEYRKWNEGMMAERNPEVTFPQNSILTLTNDSLLIHKSGYIYDPTNYMVGGYWAFQRLADLIPINFKLKD